MVCRPESVGKLQSNYFQSYFQLFSDPEFVKKDGIYLFREYSDNYKSVRSIDKLLYLDAHACHIHDHCCLWKRIVGKLARDVKIVREDLNVFYRS